MDQASRTRSCGHHRSAATSIFVAAADNEVSSNDQPTPGLMTGSGLAESSTRPVLTVRLPAQALVYENMRALLGAIVATSAAWLLGPPLLPGAWNRWVPVLVSCGAAANLVADLLRNWIRQQSYRISAGGADLQAEHGRFVTTSVSIVPGAVLSVDLVTGPILGRLGLARLRLNGIGPLPEIPPLADADARKLQRLTVAALAQRGSAI